MSAEELAAIDAWLDDLEPGCDGWYIETRLVRALRDEVTRLLEIVRPVAALHMMDDCSNGNDFPQRRIYLYDEEYDGRSGIDVVALREQARALVARLEGGVDKPGAGA